MPFKTDSYGFPASAGAGRKFCIDPLISCSDVTFGKQNICKCGDGRRDQAMDGGASITRPRTSRSGASCCSGGPTSWTRSSGGGEGRDRTVREGVSGGVSARARIADHQDRCIRRNCVTSRCISVSGVAAPLAFNSVFSCSARWHARWSPVAALRKISRSFF